MSSFIYLFLWSVCGTFVSGYEITVGIAVYDILQSGAYHLDRLFKSLNDLEHPASLTRLHLTISVYENASGATHDFVKGVEWQHGHKVVVLRHTSALMEGNVRTLWKPQIETYGLFLEEAMELSPYALIWLDRSISAVKQGLFGMINNRIIGIALSRPRTVETLVPAPILRVLNASHSGGGDVHRPFLMQTPSTLGVLYFPEQWHELIKYMKLKNADEIGINKWIHIENVDSDKWGDHWAKHLLELMDTRGHYVLYPSFPDPFDPSQPIGFSRSYAHAVHLQRTVSQLTPSDGVSRLLGRMYPDSYRKAVLDTLGDTESWRCC